jgi:V/A-type H+-transporting ATPase subunit F
MLKIAVIGSRDTVLGFKAVGLEAFPVSTTEEAKRQLRALTRAGEEYAIIYVEEDFYVGMTDEIAKFKDVPMPAIILIPGRDGSKGYGQNALNEAVERAVGSNIL